jgi:hypothetical protein
MTPAPRQLKRTAYHEAGHAVAAVLMDVPFRRVTILPDAQCAGRVDLANVEPPIHVKAARDHWARRICVFLAGPLAETLYSRCWQQQPISNEHTDEFKVWEIIACFDLRAKADRVNRLRFQTLERLRAPDVWAVVEVVALELLKRKTLNSAQVHSLVQRVRPCGMRTKARNR